MSTNCDATGIDVRVLLQTNRPTPHRTPILDGLAARPDVELLVMYRWGGSGGRGWGEVPVQHDAISGWESDWQALRAARREAKSGRWDVVLSMGHSGPLSPGLAIGARLSRTALGLRADANIYNHLASNVAHRIRRRLISTSLFPRDRTGVLSIGRLNHQYWQHIGYERIMSLPYEVLRPPGHVPLPPNKATQIEAQMRLETKKCVGLFVGRLTPTKGLDLLADALTTAQDMPVEILIVGTGPMEPELRGVPGLSLVGAIPYESLGVLMQMSDFLVLPSRHEPWGLVVNEALAHGLPVLGSDAAGAIYEYRDLPQVSMFRTGSVHSLVAALRKIPEHVHSLGRSSPRIVDSRAYLDRFREGLAWVASI